MSELEEKLGAILSDPGMLQQIMGLAGSLSAMGASQQESKQDVRKPPNSGTPPEAMAKPSSSGLDPQQRALLAALRPYLHPDRLQRLERAMHAANMAGAASALLGAGRTVAGRQNHV